MPYFLLVCAVVSLMLLGCSSVDERQERAQGVLDRATEGIVSLKDTIAETASGAVQKIQATAVDVEERADKLQNGVEKLQEGTAEVKEAIR